MAVSISTARPGTIKSVGSANQGKIGNTGVAQPSGNVNVVRDYGLQGGAPVPYAGAPTTIGTTPRPSTGGTNAQAAVDAATRDWQKLIQSITQSQAVTPSAVYDVAGANARARAAAAKSQNPLYTKYLNDALNNYRLQQKQEQQKADMANKAIESGLSNTLEDTGVARNRATEDAATATNQINQTADEFQTDSGTRFAIDRIEEARNLASSGKTGGLGAQQTEASQAARNTTEKRQAAKFDQGKLEQAVAKARTFEDLATTDTRAIAGAKTDKEKVKFDLDVYISQYGVGKDIKKSGAQVVKFADSNEQARQSAIAQATADYNKKYFDQFIAKLSNPNQIQATRAKYGGAF